MPENASIITEHGAQLLPIVVIIGKALIWIIVTLGSGLIGVLVWIGKQFTNKVNGLDVKLDTIHEAMLGCPSCRESLDRNAEHNRRVTDWPRATDRTSTEVVL